MKNHPEHYAIMSNHPILGTCKSCDELRKEIEDLKEIALPSKMASVLQDLQELREVKSKLKTSMPEELWKRLESLLDELEQDIRDGTFDRNNNRSGYLHMIKIQLAAIATWRKGVEGE